MGTCGGRQLDHVISLVHGHCPAFFLGIRILSLLNPPEMENNDGANEAHVNAKKGEY